MGHVQYQMKYGGKFAVESHVTYDITYIEKLLACLRGARKSFKAMRYKQSLGAFDST
jgi:hypothetical protein